MDWWKDLIQKLNKFKPKLSADLTSDTETGEESREMGAVKTLQRRVRMQALTAVVSVAALLVLVFAMTAAWYTNVAKTSDLMFETESWGFDEEAIKVAETAISVAPGESGIIPIEVDNSTNTDGVKIGVTIDKRVLSNGDTPEKQTQMRELRKRIYFYVDTPYTYTFEEEGAAEAAEGGEAAASQSETVSRVYLGSAADRGYTYEILPGQKLQLTEEYYNDVPVKWMWTYDMLGYYFYGQVTKGENGTGTVFEDEYLRPIEYDYAYAVFGETYLVGNVVTAGDTYGQLISTDGIDKDVLLTRISAEDGYEGRINPANAVTIKNAGEDMSHIYYPVEVGADGVGVWAYLCNKDEIEAGITFDNSLREREEGVTLTAKIVFTAVNVPATVQEVDSPAALNEALNDDEIDVVTLKSGLTLTAPVEVIGGTDKVIDLNGYVVDYNGTADMFVLQDGAGLTVMNGALNNATNNTAMTAFSTSGAELVLSGVTATGFARVVDNDETKNEENDAPSTIRITNCDFDTTNVSVMIRGSGLESDSVTKVIIEGSRITSDYMAISGNGNSPNAGTEIVIVDSEIDGTWSALYQPQQRATTIVKNSKLSGYTGIAIKGGTATIIDSTIVGNGTPYNIPTNAGSGFTDTGDGVYVEAVYDWSATVIIKGEATKISSAAGYAVELFGMANKGPGKVVVQEGILEAPAGAKGSVNWNGVGTLELFGTSMSESITIQQAMTKNSTITPPIITQ